MSRDRLAQIRVRARLLLLPYYCNPDACAFYSDAVPSLARSPAINNIPHSQHCRPRETGREAMGSSRQHREHQYREATTSSLCRLKATRLSSSKCSHKGTMGQSRAG